MKNLLLICAITLFLFACKASSETTNSGPAPVQTFQKIDKDNNGFINKKEANVSPNKVLKKNFKQIDKNKDGRVSLKEYKKHK